MIRSFPVGEVLAARGTPGLEDVPRAAGGASGLEDVPQAAGEKPGGEDAAPRAREAVFRACLEEARRRGIPLRLLQAGDRISLEPGLTLEVLAPSPLPLVGTDDDVNNHSLALRLAYGKLDLMLMGDTQSEEEEVLCRGLGAARFGQGLGDPGRITVLKTAHQGSKDSSSAPFLAAVRPRWALISVGRHNRYGHPNGEVLGRFREAGARVMRTDRDGAITLSSDGSRVWVTARSWHEVL